MNTKKKKRREKRDCKQSFDQSSNVQRLLKSSGTREGDGSRREILGGGAKENSRMVVNL